MSKNAVIRIGVKSVFTPEDTALPWLRQLVGRLYPRRSQANLCFAVENMELGQAFFGVLLFSPVRHFPPVLQIHIHFNVHRHYIVCTLSN